LGIIGNYQEYNLVQKAVIPKMAIDSAFKNFNLFAYTNKQAVSYAPDKLASSRKRSIKNSEKGRNIGLIIT